MPELPEVEAARKAIEENCLGKKIKKAIIASDAKVIDGVSPSDFEAALVGKTLISAHRKGKNLWLQLDSPPFPSFQFGMAGAIYIKGVAVTKYKRSAVNDTDEWPSKYSKLFVELDDGLELSFTDKRRFAKVRLLNNPVSVPPISELGPDALLQPMAVDEFYKSLCKKKMPIKALLLDQSFISGIGNWIADEVLYQARIHPQQSASSFTKESCATLLKCIKEVIEKAIEVEADSSQFPNSWIFHSREKKPGKAFIDGKKIDFITSGGRTTAYVPELQKLSGNQISKRRNSEDNNDDNGVEGEDAASNAASLEDGAAKKAKPKRELKPRGRGKKPPPEQKTKATDADEDNDEAACNANNEDDQVKEEDQKKKEQSASNDKQPNGKKRSDKTVTDHNNKKPKKTVK